MMTKNKRTFTLIEMLIVIVIIGILAAALIPRLQSVQGRARDTKRKVDLRGIVNAFEIYRLDNSEYPLSQNAVVTSCVYAYNCGVSSMQNTSTNGNRVSGVVNTYMTSLPLDPINNSSQPYPFYTGNYAYYYANVNKYGSGLIPYTYDLYARLENINDPDRCAVNTGMTYGNGNLICASVINGGRSDMGQVRNAAPKRN